MPRSNASVPDVGTRTRKLTEKGLEYTLDLRYRRRDKQYKALETKSEHIRSLMDQDTVSSSEMNHLYSHWLTLFEDFEYCHEEYTSLLNESAKQDDNVNWYKPRNLYILMFKAEVETWFRAVSSPMVKTEQMPEASLPRVDSLVPPRADDVVSGTSLPSHKSGASRSSITSARIKEEQKQAELRVRAAHLQKKRLLDEERLKIQQEQLKLEQGIEESKLRLRQQQEEMKLQEEMDMSNARSQVLDTFDELVSLRSVGKPEPSHYADDETTPKLKRELVDPIKHSKPIVKNYVVSNNNMIANDNVMSNNNVIPNNNDHDVTFNTGGKQTVSAAMLNPDAQTFRSYVQRPDVSVHGSVSGHSPYVTFNLNDQMYNGQGRNPSYHTYSTPYAQASGVNPHPSVLATSHVSDIPHTKEHMFSPMNTDGHLSNTNVSHIDMAAVVRELKKPTTDIKLFSGDPLEYQRFMRQFKSKVKPICDDEDEMLTFLEQNTRGEALNIVRGLGPLGGAVAYPAALKQLEERYGNPEIIVDAFIKKALNWPDIKANNAKALDEYAIFLFECLNAVNSLGAMTILDYSENMKRLVNKLPYHLHDRWRNVVFQAKDHGKFIVFSMLVNFVRQEAKKANDPMYGRDAMYGNQGMNSGDRDQGVKLTQKRAHNTFATNITQATPTDKHFRDQKSTWSTTVSGSDNVVNKLSETKSQNLYTPKRDAYSKPCLHCENGEHPLAACDTIAKLQHRERTDILKSKGLCWGCLKPGHQRIECRYKATCKQCLRNHPTILHYDVPCNNTEESATDVSQTVESKQSGAYAIDRKSSHTGAGDSESIMVIAPVRVRKRGSAEEIETYAFIDPGSNVSFGTESLMHRLGNPGKKVHLNLNTMGVPHSMDTYLVNGLEITDLKSENVIKLPGVYTKESIPVSHNHIPTQKDVSQWPHLEGVILPEICGNIELLIGNNVPDVYTPLEVKTGPAGSPHAARTRIGWIVWNMVRPHTSHGISVNRADVTLITAIEKPRETLKLTELYGTSTKLEFSERTIDDVKEQSPEDDKFSEKLEIRNTGDLHELNLPFINLPIPDIREMAHSASPNSSLLQGLKATDNIVSVLAKLKKDEVAVMADTESLLHQVKVTEKDRDFLKFYWWPNDDANKKPVPHRLTVHLLGALSSPTCANLALHQDKHNNFEYEPVTLSTIFVCFVTDQLCRFAQES